jgi:hypothetical protein
MIPNTDTVPPEMAKYIFGDEYVYRNAKSDQKGERLGYERSDGMGHTNFYVIVQYIFLLDHQTRSVKFRDCDWKDFKANHGTIIVMDYFDADNNDQELVVSLSFMKMDILDMDLKLR